jgi:hypothetical protein
MKKIKSIYNDKKMALKNPDRKGNTHTGYTDGRAKTQPDHIQTSGTARDNFRRWGKEIFQAKPERFARSVFDAGYAQSGQAFKQGAGQQ